MDEDSNNLQNNTFHQLHRVVFGIEGMTCSACVNTIQKQIGNYFEEKCADKGIVLKLCNVTLITEEGVVEYTTTAATPPQSVLSNQIKEVVEDCGFDCNIV